MSADVDPLIVEARKLVDGRFDEIERRSLDRSLNRLSAVVEQPRRRSWRFGLVGAAGVALAGSLLVAIALMPVASQPRGGGFILDEATAAEVIEWAAERTKARAPDPLGPGHVWHVTRIETGPKGRETVELWLEPDEGAYRMDVISTRASGHGRLASIEADARSGRYQVLERQPGSDSWEVAKLAHQRSWAREAGAEVATLPQDLAGTGAGVGEQSLRWLRQVKADPESVQDATRDFIDGTRRDFGGASDAVQIRQLAFLLGIAPIAQDATEGLFQRLLEREQISRLADAEVGGAPVARIQVGARNADPSDPSILLIEATSGVPVGFQSASGDVLIEIRSSEAVESLGAGATACIGEAPPILCSAPTS